MTALGLFRQVLVECWFILRESAPYLLFGFAAAGAVHALVPGEAVARHLGKGRVLPVIKAALFGIPLPLCSCGVLPAALGLRNKGAGKGPTLSFLVSTPETGLDSMALTLALMDPLMTVFRPLAAFVTAVLAGLLENAWGGKSSPPPSAARSVATPLSPPCERVPTFGSRLREGLRFAFGELLGDLAPWMALGFLLAGLISVLVPPELIARHLGAGLLPMLVMLVAGIPLYICATASTPIAAALILKGLSPGAALVFLLAGPATNLASLTALTGTLGLGTTVRYLISISLGALAMGGVLDGLYASLDLTARAVAGSSAEVFPHSVGAAAAVLLIALALRPILIRKSRRPRLRPGST